MFKIAMEKLWWLMTSWLSDSGLISFGRGISALITIYYLTQDAWFYHRTGHLIDNSTLGAQIGFCTIFYLQTAGKQIMMGKSSDGKTDPPAVA